MSEHSTIFVGRMLGGRYKLVSPIATGGMGEVWRARDQITGKQVAAKVLRPELSGEEISLSRLRLEAQNAMTARHPNIAAVLDSGEDNGQGWIIMELVVGRPLTDYIGGGRSITVPELIPILVQTAYALDTAARAGIVHRDIKPANLMIRQDGLVKLTDFGISFAEGQANLTAAGMVMGTAQYLAPEQALGKEANAAGDLYALGVIAFEALQGQRPYTGKNQVEIALAHVKQPIPKLPDSVPDELAQIIYSLLAKEPGDRPASGATLARSLISVARKLGIANPTRIPDSFFGRGEGENAASAAAPVPAAASASSGAAARANATRAASSGAARAFAGAGASAAAAAGIAGTMDAASAASVGSGAGAAALGATGAGAAGLADAGVATGMTAAGAGTAGMAAADFEANATAASSAQQYQQYPQQAPLEVVAGAENYAQAYQGVAGSGVNPVAMNPAAAAPMAAIAPAANYPGAGQISPLQASPTQMSAEQLVQAQPISAQPVSAQMEPNQVAQGQLAPSQLAQLQVASGQLPQTPSQMRMMQAQAAQAQALQAHAGQAGQLQAAQLQAMRATQATPAQVAPAQAAQTQAAAAQVVAPQTPTDLDPRFQRPTLEEVFTPSQINFRRPDPPKLAESKTLTGDMGATGAARANARPDPKPNMRITAGTTSGANRRAAGSANSADSLFPPSYPANREGSDRKSGRGESSATRNSLSQKKFLWFSVEHWGIVIIAALVALTVILILFAMLTNDSGEGVETASSAALVAWNLEVTRGS